MPVDRRDLRRRLFSRAAEQGGYFSAGQAKEIGYSYQAQAHHVGAGNWLRIDRGLFRLAEWVPDLHAPRAVGGGRGRPRHVACESSGAIGRQAVRRRPARRLTTGARTR